MPISKKRKKREGRSRRDRDLQPSQQAESSSGGGGLMSGMRGGIKNLVGAGEAKKKKESLVSKIVTWVLVAVALYFVARRFGILR